MTTPLFLSSKPTSSKRGIPFCASFRAPELSRKCAYCGTEWPEYRGAGVAYLDGRIGKWPDVIGMGPPSLFHERVITTFREEKVGSFSEWPVEIKRLNDERPLHPKPPQYFYLQINSFITVDLERSGIAFDSQCPNCFKLKNRGKVGAQFPIPGSWDGSDVVKIRNNPTRGIDLCTARVVKLAHDHRWTNFNFLPVDIDPMNALSRRGVDYLGKTWPPNWYPPENGLEGKVSL